MALGPWGSRPRPDTPGPPLQAPDPEAALSSTRCPDSLGLMRAVVPRSTVRAWHAGCGPAWVPLQCLGAHSVPALAAGGLRSPALSPA